MAEAITVVAAVFRRNEKYLACRKKPGLPNAGLWEFPGGKQHADESAVAALYREIREELGVTPIIGASLGSRLHHYDDKTINLHCFFVNQWQGEFVPVDHDKLQWFTLDELAALSMSAADIPFIDRIRSSLR